jgi:hypothetical protein
LAKKGVRLSKFFMVLEDNIWLKRRDKDDCRDIPFKNFS